MALRRGKDGTWKVDIRYMAIATGEKNRFRRSIGKQKTKRQAQAVHDRIVRELSAGNSANLLFLADGDKETIPFSGFSKMWFDTYVVANNKHSEIKSKQTIIRKHLYPFFGDADIASITAEDVERLKIEKLSEIGPKTVNNILTVLRTMLNFAVKWDYIDKNPMNKVQQLKVQEADFNFYDKEETALFVQHSEHEWRVLFFTGFRTGMRLGELFGLRWQDIDFKRSILRVQQNYVKGHFGSPKSGKSRVIPLSPQLRAVLLTYRHDKGELVFCRDDGSPINRDVIKRPFWRAIEKAGLKMITPHEMRDSFASQLVMEGRSLKEIQELLGHSDIRQTMKYAHLSPGYLQEAVATLDEPSCTSEVHEEELKVGQELPNPQKTSAPIGAKYLKLIKNQ